MRALKLLPLARRRCLMATPVARSERLPDAASFYEPPRLLADPQAAESKVTRIGPKVGPKK
ncbi:hypothetical protein [Roseococcus sp.]|uniref:hypothetical protein n=1 Tax=Roseococcus sp. TaxID=2109646 RepID=UPI003BA8C72D